MTAEEMENYINEYGKELLGFCCFLTGTREKAEDLCQDTYLKAMEIEREILPEDAKRFLVGIASNLWKNQWRKEKRRQKMILPADFDGEELSFQTGIYAPQEKDILEAYIDQETGKLVQQVVNALPERYRLIVLLYYSAELSTGEIAKELHLSRGTVTGRLSRAREKIRKGLEAKGYEG